MMEEFEMKILVLNCGSSSLKYQLIDMENEQILTKGLCEKNRHRRFCPDPQSTGQRQLCC